MCNACPICHAFWTTVQQYDEECVEVENYRHKQVRSSLHEFEQISYPP
jgi:hypothetical protein